MRPLSPPITKNLAMAVNTKAETWSFHFILHPFQNKDVYLNTNPVSHKGFIHNLSSCKNIKIITNLMDSWMKIINSTTTKKKLQIKNITQRKF